MKYESQTLCCYVEEAVLDDLFKLGRITAHQRRSLRGMLEHERYGAVLKFLSRLGLRRVFPDELCSCGGEQVSYEGDLK